MIQANTLREGLWLRRPPLAPCCWGQMPKGHVSRQVLIVVREECSEQALWGAQEAGGGGEGDPNHTHVYETRAT